MPLPGDVTTFDLEFGPYGDAQGLDALVAAGGKLYAVDPSTSRPIRVVHDSGYVIVPEPVAITIAEDGTGTVEGIPHTGQASLSPEGWAWRVEWNIASRKPSPGNLTFVAPSGATVDFDQLVPAATVPVIAISQPAHGVPAGGADGQVLAKASAADYDTEWVAQTGGGGGGGVTDHGALTGLADDDHTQYHTDARGDVRYYQKAAVDTALAAKAPTASPTFTGTVSGVTKAHVGLGNVDNTADTAKPVSTAQQTAIDTASTADRARANHTGTQSADTVVDGTTNHVFTAADDTKLGGIATGATANSSDATLLARANHTGTQSADTLTDGTTNKAFLATERTKLAGVATGATANDTDANLKNRANHTGTQTASTISDLTETVQDIAGAAIVAGTGTTVTYNDGAGTITIDSTGGGSYTDEQARDAIAAALVAGTNVTITPNDGADTITVAALNTRPPLRVATSRFFAGGMTASPTAIIAASGRYYISPFWCPEAITIDQLIVEVTTLAAGTTTTFGYYPDQSGNTPVGATLTSLGSIDTSATGIVALTLGTPLALPAGWSHFGAGLTGAPRFRANVMDDTLPPIYMANTLASGGVTAGSFAGLLNTSTGTLPGTLPGTGFTAGHGIRFAVRISSVP